MAIKAVCKNMSKSCKAWFGKQAAKLCQLIKQQYSTHQEFFGDMGIGVLVAFVLYVVGVIYAGLIGIAITNVTPITWVYALVVEILHYFAHSHNQNNAISLIISGLVPAALYLYYRFVYKRFGSCAVKWLVVTIAGIVCWAWISGTALLWLATSKFTAASPLLYIQALINLDASAKLHEYLLTAGGVGAFGLLILLLLFMKNAVPNIYGDARFAKELEIRKSGLFAETGILLGQAFGKRLCMSGFEHVTLFAPTGQYKSMSLAVPNLLFWEDSCVVSDIKLQLFRLTSGFRAAMGHKIFFWNPGSPDGITHRYNPLAIITDNPYTRIDEIQKIAAIFIPDNPKTEPIWQVQSRFLFVALVLYVLDTPEIPKTIAEVVKLVKAQPDFHRFTKEIVENRTDLDPLCRYNLMKFSELHEKTRLSILATFQSYFELFDNPLIVAATSKSDFDIRKLRREKMTIYVGITNDNLVRLSPLLATFYQQVADVMTRKIPEKNEPYGVMFLMDEFQSLRRMESFQKNIGLYREYRVRVVIIIQELSQLYEIYGRDGAKVFINAKVRIVYTQIDNETCRLVEAMLGNKTVAVKNRSRRLHATTITGDTESVNYISRPLLSAQEISMIPREEAIIFTEGYRPIYAKKLLWFKEKFFRDRMLDPIAMKSVLSVAKAKKGKKPDKKSSKQLLKVSLSETEKQKPLQLEDLEQTL